METLIYLLVGLFGIVFSVNPQLIKSSSVFFLCWFFVYLVFVVIVRRNFDVDIGTYAREMESINFSFYYITEPVVWLGQSHLYALTENPYLVFIFFDFMVALFLYFALANFNSPKWAFFSVLLFFPVVLGMQNIYRQWVASVIFLYSFSLFWTDRAGVRSYGALFASILTHNSAAIFLPALFSRLSGAKYLFFFGVLILSFFAIFFGKDFKSTANTGADLEFAYLILFGFLLATTVLLDRAKIKISRLREYRLFATLFLLVGCGVLSLSSAIAERLAMFSLIIAYPILADIIEDRFQEVAVMRIVFLTAGFVPIWIFGLTDIFL